MRRDDFGRPNVATATFTTRSLGTPEAQALAALVVCALILAFLTLPQGVHVVR